ncbi:MAG: zinc-ribbon domain-containing protein [Desulfobacteraceae bacterium]|nr:zinc-ribbon domain-containing protein [Desulfobacteraceae bacterium]
MEVVCPKCNALYKIPDNKVPAQNAVLTCKRCSHRIPVKPVFQSGSTLKVPPTGEDHSAPPAPNPVVPIPIALHPPEILQRYPHARSYNPEQYKLSEILKPTKKGDYKTGLNTLKMKLLDAVKPVLDQLLDTDERVACVAPATAYYPWEIVLGNGLLTMLYNRYVLVATDKRLVAINTNARLRKAAHYFFQFSYASIKKISKGLFGTSLTISRKQGKRRVFTSIKRSLAMEMKEWISPRIDARQTTPSEANQCVDLCPACYVPLGPGLSSCSVCQASFKSPQRAALRSLLLPGLGDFYLGHRFLGIFELIGALFVWLFALTSLATGELENMVVGIVLLLFVNGLDALLTLHMAKKGYALETRHAASKARTRIQTNMA